MNQGFVGWSITPYPSTQPYINLQDQKAAPSDGGTATAGSWLTRTLNTIAADTAGIVKLVANQIFLPPGIYRTSCSAPANHVNTHATRLRSIVDGVTLIRGSTEFANLAVQNRSIIVGIFTLTLPVTTLEVQHYVNLTSSGNGLGVGPTGGGALDGSTDVYTIAEFWKIG